MTTAADIETYARIIHDLSPQDIVATFLVDDENVAEVNLLALYKRTLQKATNTEELRSALKKFRHLAIDARLSLNGAPEDLTYDKIYSQVSSGDSTYMAVIAPIALVMGITINKRYTMPLYFCAAQWLMSLKVKEVRCAVDGAENKSNLAENKPDTGPV